MLVASFTAFAVVKADLTGYYDHLIVYKYSSEDGTSECQHLVDNFIANVKIAGTFKMCEHSLIQEAPQWAMAH